MCGLLRSATLFKMGSEKINTVVKVLQRSIMI